MDGMPVHIWVVSIVAIGVVVVGVCANLYRGADAAGAGRAGALRLAAVAGAAYTGWWVLVLVLGGREVFLSRPGAVPWVVPAMLGWIVVCLLFARRPAVVAALAHPRAAVWLTAVQVARGLAGLAFLLALAADRLPPVFAIPAGLGDLAVGVAAPLVAWRLAHDPRRRTTAVWFHRLGLADILVTVPLGALAAPAVKLFGDDTTVAMGLLPLVTLALAGAPTMFALHLVALRRLRPAPASGLVPEADGRAPAGGMRNPSGGVRNP
ncbi:hypothetical protein K7640_02625 [Micromonospora sp. PLK6-60]|uniref:hypothetical protein n=1 Tax=Micromonospora sp. PLK6-60 TaxID=2873383 RepID=UPI001CA6867E|nr:hypothetical protein [Micromonospora sp. PLK6-60]MBY8870736.1 hypothetical protein [Micromonospora sp. PLK6-60]